MSNSIKTFFILLLFCHYVKAQQTADDITIDEDYLEDQFYVGLGYNFLLNKPDPVIQRNLSYNFQLGYIKDIPINQKRNFGFGIGLGYGTNSYYSNIIVSELENGFAYRLPVAGEDFNRSKFETHAIELPFEIRWRTSNPIDYKFWRVYTGLKAEYLFVRRSKLVTNDRTTAFTNTDIEQWQFGLMLNFGYNTWNLHLYWSLTELLAEQATFDGQSLNIRPIRIGVIFYIL